MVAVPATIPSTLFHYTSELRLTAILQTQCLQPSLATSNPRDVRYGPGQYLSDMPPGVMTSTQLSRLFIGHPFQGERFTHFIAVDVTGLQVIAGRSHVFVRAGIDSLPLAGRLVGFGRN